MDRSETFVETASATAAAATATAAAVTGQRHRITTIHAGYGTTTSGATLQIKDGTSVVAEFVVYDSLTVNLHQPIIGSEGNAVSAVLAAGAASVVGTVTIVGYTA